MRPIATVLAGLVALAATPAAALADAPGAAREQLLSAEIPRKGVAMEVGLHDGLPLAGPGDLPVAAGPTSAARVLFPQVEAAMAVGVAPGKALAFELSGATETLTGALLAGGRFSLPQLRSGGDPVGLWVMAGVLPRAPWTRFAGATVVDTTPVTYQEDLSERVAALSVRALAPFAHPGGKVVYGLFRGDLTGDVAVEQVHRASGGVTTTWGARPVGVSMGAAVGLGLPFRQHSMLKIEAGYRQDAGYIGEGAPYFVGLFDVRVRMGGVSGPKR